MGRGRGKPERKINAKLGFKSIVCGGFHRNPYPLVLCCCNRYQLSRVLPQAYHPLFVWSTVLFNGRYGYEFLIAILYDAIFRSF